VNEHKKEDNQTCLKLFVVGQSSGFPDDWHEGLSWCLVYAKSSEEAVKLASDYWPICPDVHEVVPNGSQILHLNSPPVHSSEF
jgi:hypothetical protein